MRLLLIAAREDHRLLVRKHVEVEWPKAVIVEHALGIDPALDHQFAATGFDAVKSIRLGAAAHQRQVVIDSDLAVTA